MSSTTNNYTFYNMARIENDNTTQTQESLQNDRYADYTTTNYFSENATDSQIQFATQQPAVVPNSVTGSGVGSEKIENESNLLLETENERVLGRLNLMQRPFLTVPYLGRGPCYPTLENNIRLGKSIKISKQNKNLTEKEFPTKIPMIPRLKENIQNTKHIIESDVNNNWVRGGLPSRRYQKEKKNVNI